MLTLTLQGTLHGVLSSSQYPMQPSLGNLCLTHVLHESLNPLLSSLNTSANCVIALIPKSPESTTRILIHPHHSLSLSVP